MVGAAPESVLFRVATLAGFGPGEGVGGGAAQQHRSENKSWEQHAAVTVFLFVGTHYQPRRSMDSFEGATYDGALQRCHECTYDSEERVKADGE